MENTQTQTQDLQKFQILHTEVGTIHAKNLQEALNAILEGKPILE